jgi:hypothetical protein
MSYAPTQIQFLRDTVVTELAKFPKCGLDYYGFIIVMQGIEVVGSLFDTALPSDYGQSRPRFQKGFEYLFPSPPYQGRWDDFFTELRGPLVHQLRPGWTFTLTRVSSGATLDDHFTRDARGQTILVFEKLLEDFAAGLDRLQADLDSGMVSERIDGDKRQWRYLVTLDFNCADLRANTHGPLSAQP